MTTHDTAIPEVFPEAIEYADWYARQASWHPLIKGLRDSGLEVFPTQVGGGMECLSIRCSEAGDRYAWLGADQTDSEALWMNEGYQRFLSGCMYQEDADPDECPTFLPLDTIFLPEDPAEAVPYVLQFLRAAITVPLTEYQSM